jgi:hypothetical protein
MKTGVDLSRAPHVIVTLIGEFKGELGTKHHLIALANDTSLGIKLRWWLEQLLKIWEEEGCRTGSAFGCSIESVGLMSEYVTYYIFSYKKYRTHTQTSSYLQTMWRSTTDSHVHSGGQRKARQEEQTYIAGCRTL